MGKYKLIFKKCAHCEEEYEQNMLEPMYTQKRFPGMGFVTGLKEHLLCEGCKSKYLIPLLYPKELDKQR